MQYFLLDPSFTLNTIRVSNNPSASNAQPLYMYNSSYTVLYFSSDKQIDFIRKLNIHHTTFTKCLNNNLVYLNKYFFTRKPIIGASNTTLTILELSTQLKLDRIEHNKKKIYKTSSHKLIIALNIESRKIF